MPWKGRPTASLASQTLQPPPASLPDLMVMKFNAREYTSIVGSTNTLPATQIVTCACTRACVCALVAPCVVVHAVLEAFLHLFFMCLFLADGRSF